MKTRSREINILSMSALDLFCCALGAFILLALMEARYVPHLGPKAEEVQKLKQENLQLKQENQKLSKQVESMKQLLKSQEIDIAMVIDTSASMTPTLEGLKQEILTLSRILAKLSSKARMQIIEYKDACWPSAGYQSGIRWSNMVELNPQGAAALSDFAGTLKAESPGCKAGRGASEDVVDALAYATDKVPWAAQPTNRYIIVLGDEPPDPSDASLLPQAIQRARAWSGAGGHISTVFISASASDPARSRDFYRTLAEAGHGGMTDSGSGSFAMTLLEAMTK